MPLDQALQPHVTHTNVSRHCCLWIADYAQHHTPDPYSPPMPVNLHSFIWRTVTLSSSTSCCQLGTTLHSSSRDCGTRRHLTQPPAPAVLYSISNNGCIRRWRWHPCSALNSSSWRCCLHNHNRAGPQQRHSHSLLVPNHGLMCSGIGGWPASSASHGLAAAVGCVTRGADYSRDVAARWQGDSSRACQWSHINTGCRDRWAAQCVHLYIPLLIIPRPQRL